MMKRLKQPVKNQKGIAILVVMFAIMILVFIATEVSYDTSVEYIVARQQVNRLKAYYAAKSGVEISLLRVLIYKKAVSAITDALGPDQVQTILPMLDPVWQMPFTWPPILPDNAATGDKSQVEDVVKESFFDSQYLATIESEGGKMDINDLGSFSEGLRNATKAQILKIFAAEVENNETFSRKYRDFKFEELVNNIIDWVDANSESLNGGDERDKYTTRNDFIPPNAPFKTIKELNMVAEMNEDLYALLAARVTIFGTKGVNVNYAPKEVIQALDPSITEDAIAGILRRRSDPKEGGPFKDEKDFFAVASRYGVDVNAIQKSGIPLIFGVEFNFRIKSTGRFSNANREIQAVVYDIENLRTRYLGLLDKEAQSKLPPGAPPTPPKPGDPPAGAPVPAEKAKIVPPKGRPTVVYWEES